jgi:hypothetical protein
MTKRIIYPTDEGGVKIIVPSPACRVQTKSDSGVIEDCPLNSVAVFR